MHGAFNWVTGQGKQFFAILQGLFSIAGEILKAMWGAIWEWVKRKASEAWAAIKAWTSDALDSIGAWLSAFPGKALGFLKGLGGLLVDKGKEMLGGLLQGIQDRANAIFGWFGDLPAKILHWVGDLGRILYDIGRDILQGLWDGMKDIWGDVTGWLGGLGGKIVDLKGPPAHDAVLLTNAGRLVMRGFQTGLETGWADVRTALAGMTGELAGPTLEVGGRPRARQGARGFVGSIVGTDRPAGPVPALLHNPGHEPRTVTAPITVNIDLRGTVGLDHERLGTVVVSALKSYERENGPLPIQVSAARG